MKEQLAEAIECYKSGEALPESITKLGIGTKEMGRLVSAHEDVENASRGGCSDWDGGGNPHRMMEERGREIAWDSFTELCRSYGIDPYDFRWAMSK